MPIAMPVPRQPPTPPADLVLEPRWVIPVEPHGTVLEEHAVVIAGDRIAAVLPRAAARETFPETARAALHSHVLIPGLVNLHTHAAMALLRGFADDRPLREWLAEYIWPAETRFVCDAFVYDGTLLAAAEMLGGGVTCFNDMYFYPAAAGRAVVDAGMRAVLGLVVLDVPTSYASDLQAYLDRARAAVAECGRDRHLSCAVAPHAPYTVGDDGFMASQALAAEFHLPLHVHLHETITEVADAERQYGIRPLERLRRLGLLTGRTIAAHAVHLTDGEMALLADAGAHVAHCPAANLKLASGMARIDDMVARGINVGLGTDGAASNNRLDLLSEMRLAALLAKAVAGRADAVPAHDALAMATLNGARALGLDGVIGSIIPGKAADLAAIDLSAPELDPCYDPASHLVYVVGREHVTDVWVSGRHVVAHGRPLFLDAADLRRRAASWREQIAGT
ncbi:MAG TPA: TRZ/ATZ family hydrolase [Gemmatimonadales bacterium]